VRDGFLDQHHHDIAGLIDAHLAGCLAVVLAMDPLDLTRDRGNVRHQ
jgi:hypothetical protein